MLRNFVQAINLLWKPRRAARRGFAAAAGEDNRPVASAALDSMEERLAHSAGAGTTILAGTLELVGLTDVREALGEGWTPISQRLIEYASDEIQRCLDPADIFRLHGEASFLIHFDSLDKEAGERQANRIALRIKAGLIERFPEVAKAISITHFLAEVDPASLQDGDRPLADVLFERMLALREEAERAAKADRRSLIKDVQVLFSPAWHTRKHVTILNRSMPDSSYARTYISQFEELIDPETVGATHADLDCLVLTKSVEALHRVLQTSRGAFLLIPLDFRTLRNSDTAAEYLRLLDAMPKRYKKFVALEICGLPPDFPPARISQVAELLGRYAKYVAVELPLGYPGLSAVAQLGVWAISTSLSDLGRSGARQVMQLKHFSATANSASVTSIAKDAISTGLALAASDAGFTYIEGAGIHLPLREPRPPLRLMPIPRLSIPTHNLSWHPA